MTDLEEIPTDWGDDIASPPLLGFMLGTGLSVLIWGLMGWLTWMLLTL